MQKRTLLVAKVRSLLNEQDDSLLLSPEQSSSLNRQLLISAAQLNVVGLNEDAENIAGSETERILDKVIEDDLHKY